MAPQLVRSYTIEVPQAVGPDGQRLSSQVVVMVANAPYLQDQCAHQVRVGGQPMATGAQLEKFGCIRLGAGGQADFVVPDTNEQAAVAQQRDHLQGKWCRDAQGNPIACPR
jgi:hypothetical protein